MQFRMRQAFLPGLVATTFFSTTLLPTAPAFARPNWARDIGVGAGTSAVTGAISGNGSALGNAVTGAASGAAVSAVQRASSSRQNRSAISVVRDGAVGAAASVVTGKIIGNGSAGGNAIKGAASGALVNILAR